MRKESWLVFSRPCMVGTMYLLWSASIFLGVMVAQDTLTMTCCVCSCPHLNNPYPIWPRYSYILFETLDYSSNVLLPFIVPFVFGLIRLSSRRNDDLAKSMAVRGALYISFCAWLFFVAIHQESETTENALKLIFYIAMLPTMTRIFRQVARSGGWIQGFTQIAPILFTVAAALLSQLAHFIFGVPSIEEAGP